MRRVAILGFLLAFAPIVIDEATFNQILTAAHTNMRGTEYDWLSSVLQQLEQRAEQQASKPVGQPPEAQHK